MKVEGPKGPQSASKSKKSSSASGDVDFSQFVNRGAQETGATQTTRSIAQVDALLALQGAESPTERAARRQARHRADTILGELDKIRIAMLGGTLTVGHMIDVADVVASHRERIHDPALTAVMDEIDLRAQVELAKMRAALERG
ncbi:MAG: flagellar assembly protein FliX [Alphaproteobacteria bacterium]|nr:flagellar assembly protein FliX [Saprospiraceae bacterium]MCB1783216.1 flagellar assembly protein FliX [Alphaproteobacteria bacterium]